MSLVSACSCLCEIYWSQVLSWEWRCSWSSVDRRCSATSDQQFNCLLKWSYIRELTVLFGSHFRFGWAVILDLWRHYGPRVFRSRDFLSRNRKREISHVLVHCDNKPLSKQRIQLSRPNVRYYVSLKIKWYIYIYIFITLCEIWCFMRLSVLFLFKCAQRSFLLTRINFNLNMEVITCLVQPLKFGLDK